MAARSKFNRYTNMEFPEYEYREFPKMVYPEGKTDPKTGKPRGVIVNNDEEEAQVMQTGAEPVRETDDIARLQKIAEIKHVKFDKRWGVDKLTKAITEAGHDPGLDPFA